MIRASAILLGVTWAATAALAQPANDDCANATVIGALPYTDTVDTTTATTEAGDPSCYGAELFQVAVPEPNSVWYRYTPAEDVNLRVDTSASPYYAIVATVALGGCGTLGILDCDPSLGYNEQAVEVPVRAGTTAFIEIVDAEDSGGDLATVHVTETPVAPGTPLHTGLDFQVNTETLTGGDIGYQRHPDVGAAVDGTFVVAWGDEGGDDDHQYGVRARLFDATAVPTTAEIVVNQHTTSRQDHPAIAVGPGGNFVVVWQSAEQVDLDSTEVVGRRYDAAGGPLDDEFVVNTYITGDQTFPDVAMAPSGAFVVVWVSEEQVAGAPGVFAQRFDAAGAPDGGEFQVNTTAVDPVYYPVDAPALAIDSTERFVVVWTNDDFNVVSRVFDPDGVAATGEVVVSTGGYGSQGAVAIGATGQALVAWADGDESIAARFMDADGDLVGDPFEVSDPAVAEYPRAPAVGANAQGDFVVAWGDETYYQLPDPNGPGVRARRLRAGGQGVGDELQVNTYATWDQRYPRVAMAGADGFVVAWEDYTEFGRDGFGPGIFAHRFELPALPSGCPAAPRGGCKQPTLAGKGKVLLKDREDDARNLFKWKWVKGEATTLGELGDPLASDAVAICLYDGADVLMSAAAIDPGGLCAGKPCWKAIRDRGYRFVDRGTSQDGILKVLLKTGEAGKSKIVVKAKGAGFPMPTLPPALPFTVQLGTAGGACWEARYEADGVQRATAEVFGAQPSGPS